MRSDFWAMSVELREAKILPNNKDCLQNIFLIIIIKIIIIVVIILKKIEGNPCCLVRSLLP